MANEYLHGAYGHIGQTQAQSAVQAGTVNVYVGTAPINLMRGASADAEEHIDLSNKPIRLSNMADAQRKIGYSSNWKSFTLCEAISAHFNNPVGNVGPIYVINVLDVDEHRKAQQTEVSLTFNRGRAEIKSETIILDTFVIEGLVVDKDFTLDYDFAKGKLIVKLTDEAAATSPVDAAYYEVDLSSVDEDDVIGGITSEGEYSGFGAITLLYQEQNAVASIIAAPGWSHIPAVYNAMVAASQKINGHWDAFVVADIPVVDSTDAKVDTIDKAKAWQTANGYVSERSKVCWPKVKGVDGNIYHLSSLTAATMQRVDFEHSSVPMETPSNKAVGITKLYFGEDSRNRGFDQQMANELNMFGITTAVYWGGRWVIWGDHTAAYKYGADVDPRAIFDVSLRMLMHVTNAFQQEWGLTIDKPMSVQLKDTILVREQQKLDILAAKGALIGSPRVQFLEIENPVTNLMNGDFRWDIDVTPTPPLKSATVYVTYTDEGFQAYFGGEE